VNEKIPKKKKTHTHTHTTYGHRNFAGLTENRNSWNSKKKSEFV
jgi:hypothetical protein